VARRARNSKAPTLLPGRAEQMRRALAYPVSFRCHQASLDRPLTVGMVVDAPHTPGQVVSGDRVVAPSGLVPALVTASVPSVEGHPHRGTYPPSSSANIGSSTPVPETETPWQGTLSGLTAGRNTSRTFVSVPVRTFRTAADVRRSRRRPVPSPRSPRPFGQIHAEFLRFRTTQDTARYHQCTPTRLSRSLA
jgi:hypothetical protein